MKLEVEVAALGDLPREALARLWTKAYSCPPPKGVKRGLLERSAAWYLQANAFGGLSPEARRALKAAMRRVEAQIGVARSTKAIGKDASGRVPADVKFDGVTAASEPPVDRSAHQIDLGTAERRPVLRGPRRSATSTAQLPVVLSPGARLLREWNGRQHFVDVVENGYVFDGKTYRSLSAVAKRITGAHWSGPRFFGL